MTCRSVDLILMMAILVGGVLAWISGWERTRLSREYERLARITGDLTVGHATQVHPVALETGEPMHFAWRTCRCLLLLAAFAAWIACFQNRAEVARLESRLASMRSLARELVIADENKIAVVKPPEVWYGDKR